MITFTLQEFLEMIAGYNTAFWPLQLAFYALAVVAIVLVLRSTDRGSQIVTAILAVFWLWVGVVFNGLRFSRLMPAAVAFGVLFVIEGILLAVTGVIRGDLSFGVKRDVYGVVGGLMLLYAMVGYPALEILLGRGYPQLLLVGFVPCPTAVFTLGLLMWTDRPVPKTVLVIPVLYALSGVIPASIGVVEDVGLVALGLAAGLLILYRDRASGRAPELGGQGIA